ncbi:sodium/glucose cotransporter [Prevotella sp. HMSC077E09]|uniref:sodium/sugar symporter n=1 Tax=Prevotella sp. HMSC077E09 TaxID=1739487 RepID=UPI0008A1E7FA|nr:MULTISPECIES: sodium/sugar symporter [unclassified Prevotella]OFO78359.1 sodium/glucose cotransporter [Prevotella sp. HMSC077E08]OFP50762.1 sodium/glucose cotransporter [Prevotella sp. HMSC077E09]
MNSISEAISQSGFKSIDLIILVLYLVLLVSLGLFLSRNKGGKEKSANDYFLAGNTLTWWAVGASLIAANISAEQFIGMSGTGFRDGIAIAAYEVMAAVTLVVIGKFLLPVMLDRKIFTIPQFLRERYNDGVGLAFSILWLFLYVFVNLTSVAWLGALAIEQILGLQGLSVNIFGLTISMRMLIILCLFIIAGLYSIYGGLASVAWTDVMQVTFLVGGGLITAYVALSEMGKVFGTDALGALSRVYADLTTGTHVNDVHFHLVIQESHNVNAFENVPGIAAVVGGVWLTNLGYWGFNQYIIQKGLAAKSIDEAKKGLVFAGFLKILIPFIVVLPGICAYYIMQDPQAFSSIHLAGSINRADDAYPWLIRNFTPTGIKGLSFAALAAAIISSLASMFNSTSTLFTMDIYKKYINKDAKDKTLVSVGRMVAVGALLIALVAVEPLLGGLDQAFQYIQEYSGFIYPGIIVVFGLGLLWKRASSTAAVWTAILTIPMGILFKILLPNVAFQFRAGYIFIILFTFFVTVTYLDKKYIRCELPSEADQKQMLLWAKVLGFAGVLMIIAAAVVTILGVINPGGNPDTSVIAYLNDIGFQAFFFFGVLTGSSAVWLYSNSKDSVQDVKALPINLKLFATNRGYTLGTCGIVLITFLLYALLW